MRQGVDRAGVAPERFGGGSLIRAAGAGDALVVGRSDGWGRGGDRYRVRYLSTAAITPDGSRVDGMDANNESDALSDDSRRGKRRRKSNRGKAAAVATATTAAGDISVREDGDRPPTIGDPDDSINCSVSNKSTKKKSPKKGKTASPKKQKATRGSSTGGGQEKDDFLSPTSFLDPTHELPFNDRSAMMEELSLEEGKLEEATEAEMAFPAEGTASTKKKKKPRKPRGMYGGGGGVDRRSVSDDSDADSLTSTGGAVMPGFVVDPEVGETGAVPSSPKKKGSKRRGGSRGKGKKSKDDSGGDGSGPDAASGDKLGIAAIGAVDDGFGEEGGELIGRTRHFQCPP